MENNFVLFLRYLAITFSYSSKRITRCFIKIYLFSVYTKITLINNCIEHTFPFLNFYIMFWIQRKKISTLPKLYCNYINFISKIKVITLKIFSERSKLLTCFKNTYIYFFKKDEERDYALDFINCYQSFHHHAHAVTWCKPPLTYRVAIVAHLSPP